MKAFLNILLINSIVYINRINSETETETQTESPRKGICSQFENSEWKINGTNCGKFCADLLQPETQMLCDPKGNHLGCFCKEGFYRDKNLHCVIPEDCGISIPKERADTQQIPQIDCPFNERYSDCSSRCLEMCQMRDDPIACPINCDTGCFCKGMRLRNNDGVCVPNLECEPLPSDKPKSLCPRGEVFKECGNRCEELCYNTWKLFGITLNCKTCVTGCFCESGTFRTHTGTCVEREKCGKKKFIGTSIFDIFGHNYNPFKQLKQYIPSLPGVAFRKRKNKHKTKHKRHRIKA